eukprot:TRINITY_DN2017_c0_g1_i1.p3 TRINITY_DN2017_c0_g1~~TRINITY_DN2017_c0_g1_i1.p3  ORF type:complete len:109 (-),score=41.38 TRINITY_DN2017_c0_g1_i1:50-376(-)
MNQMKLEKEYIRALKKAIEALFGTPTEILLGEVLRLCAKLARCSCVAALDEISRSLSRAQSQGCLLYTSDAADDLLCVDLGGRRIIKKKKKEYNQCRAINSQYSIMRV